MTDVPILYRRSCSSCNAARWAPCFYCRMVHGAGCTDSGSWGYDLWATDFTAWLKVIGRSTDLQDYQSTISERFLIRRDFFFRIYMYIYIYIHVYMHSGKTTSSGNYKRYFYQDLFISFMHIRLYLHIRTLVRKSVYIHMPMHVLMLLHLRNTCTHACIYINIHMLIPTHIYIQQIY